MNHCRYFIILYVLHCSIWTSSANLLEKPKTKIIEALSVDNEVINDVNEPENLKKSSSELCPESENKSWQDLASRNNIDKLSPELDPLTTNTANKDFLYQYGYNPGYNYYEVNADSLGALPPKIPDNSVIQRYNKIPYPYAYPEMIASFQPYPVTYLPSVYLKYYYSLLHQDMLPNYALSNIRAPRVLRSNDDFWEQLESDSIMKNILPTMPVPFLRNTSPPSPYERAYFPYGSHDCTLPMTHGCVPKIYYINYFGNYNREMDPVPENHVDKRINQNN